MLITPASAIYERVEWIGGAYLGDDTSPAFIGAQNDPWDSQKDMALAVAGACISLSVMFLIKLKKSQA